VRAVPRPASTRRRQRGASGDQTDDPPQAASAHSATAAARESPVPSTASLAARRQPPRVELSQAVDRCAGKARSRTILVIGTGATPSLTEPSALREARRGDFSRRAGFAACDVSQYRAGGSAISLGPSGESRCRMCVTGTGR
jgi:hypothetical protein